ncbi:hypothetical protein D3C73_1489080 [compost metagenome]
MSVGFSPKPIIGTASASTATGGKVWPILTMLRDSGRKSAPKGRVTRTARAPATSVASPVAIATMVRCDSVRESRLACV